MRNKKKKYFSIILICSFIFLLISNFSLSLDTGFQSPTIASNEVLTGSRGSWTNVDNSKSQSDSYAQVSLFGKGYSDYLRVVNFEFSIPESIIDGIIVEIDKYAFDSSIRDYEVYLVLNGIIQGDNYAKSDIIRWSSSDTDNYISYGSAFDDWNSDFTYNDVNDATFGIQISVKNIESDIGLYTAFIDHIRIKVYYTITEGDNEPPTWDNLTESADPLELGNNQTISINVYDESTISNVYLEFDSTNYSMIWVSEDNYSYSNWIPTSVGIKIYRIYMIDEHGYVSETSGSFIVESSLNLMLSVLYSLASIIIIILLMVLMIYCYVKIKKLLPALLIFLFSIIIGMLSFSNSYLPFTPWFQLFFILFQAILFLLKIKKIKF